MKMRFCIKILIMAILATVTVFTVCAAKTGSSIEETGVADLRTFFPTKLGLTWIYEGSGNEYAGFTRTVMYQKDNLVQLVDTNSGTSTGQVFQVNSDAIVQSFSTKEFYSGKNLLNEQQNRRQVFLKAPLKSGTVWQDDQEKREIISINENVQVPAGFFQNVVKVKITSLTPQLTNERFEYYAPNTGLILREFISGDYSVTAKLKSFLVRDPDPVATNKKVSDESAMLAANITSIYAESKPNAELEKMIIESLNIPDEYLLQTKYYYNYVDLNMDGSDEIFVVVMGPYTSGTGGSTALHLIQTNQGMKVNQIFTLVRTPVIISDKVTKGVKELIVRYSGGGAIGTYVVLTCSDGNFTPVNQGRAIAGLAGISGKAIISNDILKDMQEGKALFLRK